MENRKIVIVRMWDGGPLREMATTKVTAAFIPYAKTINGCHFAGRYVCDGCQVPCAGVSLQNDGRFSGKAHSNWLCDLCIRGRQRKSLTSEQKHAGIQRLLAARQARINTNSLTDSYTGTETESEDDMSACKTVAAVAVEPNPHEEGYGIM
jgi:hypothetical protein